MPNIQKEIGSRIRNLRESAGIRQKALADVLGITPAAYGKLELGERGLSSEYCIALADYFNVSCDYILRGIESENLDICRTTCLTEKSIRTLQEAESRRKQLDKEFGDYYSQQENALETITDYLSFSPEDAPSKRSLLSPNQKEFVCKLEYILGERDKSDIQAYTLNAIINSPKLWDELNKAGKQLARAAHLRLITFKPPLEFSSDYEQLSKDDYCMQLNASSYIAGIAFGNFISELYSDAEFFLSGGAFVSFDTPQEAKEKAIEAGILHNN